MNTKYLLGPLAFASCLFAHTLVAAKKLEVPTVGATYTVQQLLNIIRVKSKLSNFIVPIKGMTPMTADECKGAGIKNITGSWSAEKAGVKGIIDTNLTTPVVVYYDQFLMEKLVATKRVTTANSARFARILLYFELGGSRFYIVDPWPRLGATYAKGKKSMSAVDSLLKKWGI